MEEPLTVIGVEVPRAPQLRSSRDHRGMGEWEVAGRKLLERAVGELLPLASENGLTLISGEPDQGVFDLMREHNVAQADLMTWIYSVTDRARAPHKHDVAIFLRADVVLRSYDVVKKAIEAVRVLDDVNRVEVAYRPKRQPIDQAFSIDIEADGTMLEQRLQLPSGDIGQVCPAFEVHRLMNFNLASLQVPSLTGSAFLWIDEDDFAVLETPLDFLRAELMLR